MMDKKKKKGNFMTQEIKIEKSVLYPSSLRNVWPWRKMEIGDSFEIPISGLASASQSASIFEVRSRKNGEEIKFSRRGNRMWRIK